MTQGARPTSLPMPARRHQSGASHSTHEPVLVRMERGERETLVFSTPDGEARVPLDAATRDALAKAQHADDGRLALKPDGPGRQTWSVLKDDVRAFVAADDLRVERGGASFAGEAAVRDEARAAALEALVRLPRDGAGRATLRVEPSDLAAGPRGAGTAIARLLADVPEAVEQPVYARTGDRAVDTGATAAGSAGVAHLAATFGPPGSRRRIHLRTEELADAVADGRTTSDALAAALARHDALEAGKEGKEGKEGGRAGGADRDAGR